MAGNSNEQSCVVIFPEKCSDLTESVQIERSISNFDEIKIVRRKDEGEKSIFDRPGIKVNHESNSKLIRNFETDREITIANEDSGVDFENFSVRCSKSPKRRKKSDYSKKSDFSENPGPSSSHKSDKDLEALKEAYEILRESPKPKKRTRKLSENSKNKNSSENSTSSTPNDRKRRKSENPEKSEFSEESENSPEIDEIYSNYVENVLPYYENYFEDSELPARHKGKKRSPNFYRYRYRCRYAGYNRSIKRNLRDTYKKNKSYLEYLRTNIAITAINAIKEISTKI